MKLKKYNIKKIKKFLKGTINKTNCAAHKLICLENTASDENTDKNIKIHS